MVIFVVILGWANIPVSSQMTVAQRQLITLKRQVEKNHYQPRAVNDSFSSAVFNTFIRSLDNHQEILLNGEYQQLSSFRYLLDDELHGKSWAFLSEVTSIFTKALKRTDSLTTEILKKPFEFKAGEVITFTRSNSFSFPADVAAQKTKWTKWFKFLLLNHAYSMAIADSAMISVQESIARNESVIREKLRKGAKEMFVQDDKSSVEGELLDLYLQAVASAFDPHTNYLSQRGKEDFQAELSTVDFSFGFDINETKEGRIVVSGLVPGGPAWKSGEIHKQDEILQLQWEGRPPVEVSTLTLEEVDDILAASNHDELKIKVKKQNSAIKTVSLRKEKLETEEEVVHGYLLSGERKVGYISLPDFYTSWEDEAGSGCANDVAKEIVKMKKEALDGLILDLRYNGGGSMNEALQLCGIFIDEGPLTGLKSKDGKLTYGKDPNRGTIYDGPLLILVNNQSASASELVAAALQDYNRAVIVGGATYGKATMQQILPLDTVNLSKEKSPNGFVKVTLGKLYRVNGQTAQATGVVPDVLLPDAFEGLEYSEKFLPHALPADTVKRNGYYKPLQPLPLEPIRSQSNKRVKEEKSFVRLQAGISRRKAEIASGKYTVPLDPAAFEKWQTYQEEENSEESSPNHDLFRPENYNFEKERLRDNAVATELNTAVLESIAEDIHVQEAYRIMKDLITHTKK